MYFCTDGLKDNFSHKNLYNCTMGVDSYYAVFLLVQLMDCVSRLSIFIILRSGGVSACPGEADQTEPCNNQDCKGKTFSSMALKQIDLLDKNWFSATLKNRIVLYPVFYENKNVQS